VHRILQDFYCTGAVDHTRYGIPKTRLTQAFITLLSRATKLLGIMQAKICGAFGLSTKNIIGQFCLPNPDALTTTNYLPLLTPTFRNSMQMYRKTIPSMGRPLRRPRRCSGRARRTTFYANRAQTECVPYSPGWHCWRFSDGRICHG
jgi:hypothetical protein